MEDADDVDRVAAELLARDGPVVAVAVLREWAEIAAGIGDRQSAEAWGRISRMRWNDC